MLVDGSSILIPKLLDCNPKLTSINEQVCTVNALSHRGEGWVREVQMDFYQLIHPSWAGKFRGGPRWKLPIGTTGSLTSAMPWPMGLLQAMGFVTSLADKLERVGMRGKLISKNTLPVDQRGAFTTPRRFRG